MPASPAPAPRPARPAAPAARRPLTLMHVIAGMTVLAAIAWAAMPWYQRALKQHLALQAAHDLTALQRHIQDYITSLPVVDDTVIPVPSPAIAVATPRGTVTTTVSLMQQFYAQGWQPAAAERFQFGAAFDAGGYTLSATGTAGLDCRLSLVLTNATRTAPTQVLRAARGADCGFSTW
ncbi:MAG: hypothetical protein QM617_11075 [Comamonas sp.]